MPITKEVFETIETAIIDQNTAFIAQITEDLHPADICAILQEMDETQQDFILKNLDTEVVALVLTEFDEDAQQIFLKSKTSQEIAHYIDCLDSDDAVDMLKPLSIQVREEVVALMKKREKARNITQLLPYDADTAGGLMAKEMIRANVNWNVLQCIEEIRRQAEKVEKIYSIYVVDNKGILLGIVSLKKIILSADNTLIADIFDEDIHSVATHQTEIEVADLMRKYDLETLPVVNVQGKLLGRIAIDDVVDVITEQADLERQLMSGISADIEEDDNLFLLSRARLPWLIIGMFGGISGANFIGLFEKDLILVPAMAFFIPLITATGGNVGIQSSSIILQSLANKTIFNDMSKRLLKVFLVALINGIIIAGIVFGFVMIMGEPLKLALVVSLALFFVIILASFTGTITPIILNRLKINPALASGPFITTANDLLGLAVYFLTARMLYF